MRPNVGRWIIQPNSDWLNSTRERLYGEHIRKSTFVADRIRRTEGEILRVIILHGSHGIPHGKLAKAIKIDRKNLGAYTKRLIDRKLIRRENGNHGRYFVTGNPYGNTLYSAYLFGNMIKERILPCDSNLVLTNEEEKIPENMDFVTYTSRFRPKFTNDSELQNVLFEFSNMVGAFVLYVFIQGLDPVNNRIIESDENIEKDRLVQEWVQNTLSEVVGPDLLASFKESILPSLDGISIKPEDPYTDIVEYLGKKPLFQLSEKLIKELVRAYARLYPVMFRELEKMRHELPTEIHKFEEHSEYIHQRRKLENVCNHEYNESVFRYERIKHCRKCHHTVFQHRKH